VVRALVISTLLLGAGCTGVLDEQRSSADASLSVPTPPCDDVITPDTDGHHMPGEHCLQCHIQGGEGMPYTYAGTLFDSRGGAAPVAGATIHVIDANGMDAIAISQANGNFWSTDPITFPAVAFVSLCPDVRPMIGLLAEPQAAGGLSEDASCNRPGGGCHTSGARVH